MTPQEALIHNEKVKLTANFLSRIGLIMAVVGIVLPMFDHAPLTTNLLYGGLSVIVGVGLNIWAFCHLGRLVANRQECST